MIFRYLSRKLEHFLQRFDYCQQINGEYINEDYKETIPSLIISVSEPFKLTKTLLISTNYENA